MNIVTDFDYNTSNFIINISSSSFTHVMNIYLKVSITDRFFTNLFTFFSKKSENKVAVLLKYN